MRGKTVLILEDHKAVRETLSGALKDRGFTVFAAATIPEARELLKQLGDRLDVLLLDMEIAGSDITGAEFGLEVKEYLKEWPPEFLIHSVHGEDAYYRLAFRLGAATYIRKPGPLAEIVRHVRALALRRALAARATVIEKIERIAEKSRSGAEAVALFCEEVLCPELKATLGTPFVLLVGQRDETLRLGSDLDLPKVSPVYDRLQTLAYSQPMTKPFTVKVRSVPEGTPEPEWTTVCEVFGHLEGAAFIPLGGADDSRLSLGVLQRDRALPFTEDAVLLARVIGELLSQALMILLLDLTKRVERYMALVRKQRAVLESTSDFCLYVGQEQEAVFRRALASGALVYDRMPRELERLLAFGENLRKAGEMLSWIVREEDEPPAVPAEPTSAAQVVREAWSDLIAEFTLAGPDSPPVRGDCWVLCKPDDLGIAVSRILEWMMQRTIEAPADEKPGLSVVCKPIPEKQESHIIFEDRSRRLPRNLRERLFAPFSSPILEDPERPGGGQGEILGPYLSKVLVELENHGSLDDCSDDLEGDLGHRFVMRFPEAATAYEALS